MRRGRSRLVVIVLSLVAAYLVPARAARDPKAEQFWPQWRGPYANGGSGVAFPETLARVVKELKGFRRVSTGHDPGPVPPRSKTGDLMSWSDLEDYAEFNRVFLEKVRASIAAGLTAAQAAAALDMPEKFKAYDMREAAANVATIYRELGH